MGFRATIVQLCVTLYPLGVDVKGLLGSRLELQSDVECDDGLLTAVLVYRNFCIGGVEPLRVYTLCKLASGGRARARPSC